MTDYKNLYRQKICHKIAFFLFESGKRFHLLWWNSKLAGLEEIGADFWSYFFFHTTYYASDHLNQGYHRRF